MATRMTLLSVRTGVNHDLGPKQFGRKMEQSRNQTKPQIIPVPTGLQMIQYLNLANELNHAMQNLLLPALPLRKCQFK